jgi:hypothetical protein
LQTSHDRALKEDPLDYLVIFREVADSRTDMARRYDFQFADLTEWEMTMELRRETLQ